MCARDPPNLRVDEATQVCALRLAKGSLSGDTCAFTKVLYVRITTRARISKLTAPQVLESSLKV
jgi:hypothetical protein